MSHLVIQAVNEGDQVVLNDLHRLLGVSTLEHLVVDEIQFNTPARLTNKILHTIYMGTENSTLATRARAELLASEISSYHNSFNIDTVVSSVGE